MSQINISENLFLEVAELKRMKRFLVDDGYKRAILPLIKRFGIVVNDDNTFFKPIKTGEKIVINPGLAFDSNLNAIVLKSSREFTLSDTGTKQWLILRYATTHFEEGIVSVNSDGSISGINTKFTEILRGQPNFPTKIKFQSEVNREEYEVVSVISDNSAVISGILAAEAGLSYSVVGTFTPGFQVPEDKKEIYTYDSCEIEIRESEEQPTLAADEFIIGYVEFNEGIMNVADERIYNMFNSEYTLTTRNSGVNPLVSLMQVSAIGGIESYKTKSVEFELILEHGYTVDSFEFAATASDNIFRIASGHCNFLQQGDIPDNMFSNWLLLNRKNMKSVIIDSNENKTLHISQFNSEILQGNSDFIIVPNATEIEYEIMNSNAVAPSIPFYFRESIISLQSRVRTYGILPSAGGEIGTSIKIRYRLIDGSGNRYVFNDLATAQFINVEGITETLADSGFEIDMVSLEPEKDPENYS